MTRRKGELTIARIKRGWPHSVVVPREVLDTILPLAVAYPSMAPLNQSVLFADRQFVRVFFSDAGEAEMFRRRARGWTWVENPTEDRAATAWPPRDRRAVACV